MRHDKIYNEVESIAKESKLMEKRYEVESFPSNEPYFTTSQETDIHEMISDGMGTNEIIDIMKQW
jgi:DNA-binding NarL/FixJ family response regulator